MAPEGSPLVSCVDGLPSLCPSRDLVDHTTFSTPIHSGGNFGDITPLEPPDEEHLTDCMRSRAKTMRTKDIEKSPVPHRFNLVPHGKLKLRPSGIEIERRSASRGAHKHCLSEIGSIYDCSSPTIGEADSVSLAMLPT